jgi:hypothetical protein
MTNDRIVVAVDGSSESMAAADWALDEAFSRGCDVEFVNCWESPRECDRETPGVDFRTLEAQMVRSTTILDRVFAALGDRVARNQVAGSRVRDECCGGRPVPRS